MTASIRRQVRAIVTASIADELDVAGPLAAELAQDPQIAANAILALADLVDDVVHFIAAGRAEPTEQVWRAVAVAEAANDSRYAS